MKAGSVEIDAGAQRSEPASISRICKMFHHKSIDQIWIGLSPENISCSVFVVIARPQV